MGEGIGGIDLSAGARNAHARNGGSTGRSSVHVWPGAEGTARADALEAENRAVRRSYRLLDTETAAVSAQLRCLTRADTSRTPGALSDRDALSAAQARRFAQLRAAEERLCFGRLDLDDGARHHIGRVGLADPDGAGRALLDWRAPAAAVFHQATRAQRMNVVRRRHLTVRGRRVTAVQDELLDLAAGDAVDGGAQLDADAALLASLDAPRDGHVHDVVATIQAEQDRIIRAPMSGVLVVQGGPGTGKTVVALHRAALHVHAATSPTAAARLMVEMARRERAEVGERSVAIICLPALQAHVQRLIHHRAHDGGPPVRLLSPDEAKGLEFDVVLVADPDRIDAAAGPRASFVALTRATRRLHVVTVSTAEVARTEGRPVQLTTAASGVHI